MSAEDSSSERVRASWQRFNRAYAEMLELALAQATIDEGGQATILKRLIGSIQYSGLQLDADPARPVLINPQYPTWDWGHSNPDTLYLSAWVDDDHDYRVYGTLGSVAQTTFGIYTGFADQSTAVKVSADELDVEADGSFEIFFTRSPHAGNWFRLPAGARSFGCYQTFGDWEKERKGAIHIECLNDAEPVAPERAVAAADRFDANIDEARDLFSMWVRDIPDRVFKPLPANEAMTPFQPPAAMAGAWFSAIRWELDEDEALVVDYPIPPGSTYVGICLTNWWSQMIEPARRQTSLNTSQAEVHDGRVRVLVSTQDSGVPNWLDARGFRSGIVTWRTSVAQQPPRPTVTKIRLAELDDYFDPKNRMINADRVEAIVARERHFADRLTP